MSRLITTKRAYDKLADLLDQEIRKRSGSTKDLEEFRKTMDVAFYLLGWAQFEHLVRQESNELVDQKAAVKTVDRHAWEYLRRNMKDVPVRSRLDLIFHSDDSVRNSLDKDYTVRNDAAHNYKNLPKDAEDVSAWLDKLADLVGKF